MMVENSKIKRSKKEADDMIPIIENLHELEIKN
jgi:hypothetical protein